MTHPAGARQMNSEKCWKWDVVKVFTLQLLMLLLTYFVFSKVFCIFLVIFSMALCLLASGRRSILFRTTTIFWQAICPITKHSADCVCIPFVTSMTSIIRSIIWAPGQELTVRTAAAQRGSGPFSQVASITTVWICAQNYEQSTN